MYLFTKSDTQSLEAAAQRAGVPLSSLMENAGLALAQELHRRLPALSGKQAVILCGKGNNGGDGFVCARHLVGWGMFCTVLLLHGPPATPLAAQAFQRLPESVTVLSSPQSSTVQKVLGQADAVADCVFGFSFRGELDPVSRQVFTMTEPLSCLKLSADLPSGVECDTGRASPGAFRAQATLAFTVEKPAHHSYPAKSFCGQVLVRPVGIPPALVDEARTSVQLTGPEQVRPLLPPPDIQANKGTQGRLLLVCGSYGMAGACIMAARAALRCGVGLLHIVAEASIYPILAAAVPEAIYTLFDPAQPAETAAKLTAAHQACTACVAGCGLGGLVELLCPILFSLNPKPLLLDADALNYLSRHPETTPPPGPLLLTPHPGEASRLTGRGVPEIQEDRIATARQLAEKFHSAVLLKGAATVIASPPGALALNPTGNPGMPKGGSGDVLAGVVGALLAQGVQPFSAAWAGAWLHGRAGDLCQRRLSARAMLPTDLTEALPEILKEFESLPPLYKRDII